MQNLENMDVFKILITQKLLKCQKDPFVRLELILFNSLIICSAEFGIEINMI